AAGIAGATVTGGTVGGFDRGIAIGASEVTVARTTVTGSATGVKIYGHARDVALNSVTVRGGRTGVTASGATTDVVLSGLHISNTARKGLASASKGLTVVGGSVSGTVTGVDLGASARIRTLTISDSRRGIHLSADVHATGQGLDVLAERKGIEADSGAWI